MKLFTNSALALCLLIMIGCADSDTPSAETDALIANASSKVEANVSGMDCTGCSYGIESALAEVTGVTAAKANHATGEIEVALADDADAEAAKAEIEKVLGVLSNGKYTVNTIAVSTKADAEAEAAEEPATEEPADGEPASEEPAAEEQASADLEQTLFTVTGMSCQHCSSKVTKALAEVDGVESVYVCHKSGTATVTAAEGAHVCPVTVAKTIESTGFKAAQQ